jgi:hypothetical protein
MDRAEVTAKYQSRIKKGEQIKLNGEEQEFLIQTFIFVAIAGRVTKATSKNVESQMGEKRMFAGSSETYTFILQ